MVVAGVRGVVGFLGTEEDEEKVVEEDVELLWLWVVLHILVKGGMVVEEEEEEDEDEAEDIELLCC